MSKKRIQSALISVFHKDGLEPIVKLLHQHGVQLISTGGTGTFIENLGIPYLAVEDMTDFPSVFGGRVKTLHPKVFGGILNRRENSSDQSEKSAHKIADIDLVIVDLYPFEATVASGASHEEIIEKIDIGGISLIRAAAKNYHDVVIVPSMQQYATLEEILERGAETTEEERKYFAKAAFAVSSKYDTAIQAYFSSEEQFAVSASPKRSLRYGENPHQAAHFYGDISEVLEQLHGKELSYNNLVDVDAAISLVEEFKGQTAFAIIKHTNACGVATAPTVKEAYLAALAADSISAFGGILATNQTIDLAAAEEINQLFCEVVIAPAFDQEALELLKSKKNRVLLVQKAPLAKKVQVKSLLNGLIVQDEDLHSDSKDDLKVVTKLEPSAEEVESLLFASKIAKHTKSNTIVLAKNGQMLASGMGQTSRVDALEQAIKKAKHFNMDLKGASMASDAFFPFPDCVEIAAKAGIKSVIQPGGSIKDQDSIDYCNANGLSMVVTGIRHFKH
ncbi:MAG: bifunctional phosphoribosylaminoimidazolecarboxamide formyltransferase/IMP cyclohydrolase [Cyclobacteriaceae bacterium]|nr:bifunctional phosphoribosylaminoimidazolecarboxamide formyltransferase/IMP cyclohydrolase [Cyclobacteriaceae bacterium]MCH8514987.1 bifunctional phosphoribosylaminoimidazolecarboxamide formyltransferase/IMP cyclohydrolase [Cyclobacteriaceae bacterium]